MVKKIALEEHFLCPGFIEYWNPTVAEMPTAKRERLLALNTDFGETRLASMDKAGIERAVLGLAGPGVQAERDAATAIRNAQAGNDFLAKEIGKRPDRYSGFAHLPMQDARAAANELERCVKQLKFCGAMINGHTNGQYLDHPSLAAFWERAEALDTLIYIHPTDPVSVAPVLQGHPGLRRATWEWTFETGSHALRLVFGGVFDRFPKARVGLGHMGETLPFLLWRFDSRTGPDFYNVGLKHPVSHYIKHNIEITTSGMCSAEPLNAAIAALGRDRVMFSADYPFEKAEEAGHWLDTEKLDEGVRADIAYNNAKRLLKL
jgi:2,3-dihydroxybenzoate decarboxylase